MPLAGIDERLTGAVRFRPPPCRMDVPRRKAPGGEMCKLLAAQDPQRFKQTSRSLRISGQSTSIRLEAAFWEILDSIAASEGVSVPRLVAIIHDEAVDTHGDVSNFASLLRTVCLIYQGERAERAIRRNPPG
jgi:predicted DNA-binding ribbon-helix-helix protein